MPPETTAEVVNQQEPIIGPFTKDQLEAANRLIKDVQSVFGHTVTVNNVGHGPEIGNHKTMGDAADKALDLVEAGTKKTFELASDAISQIAATTEKAAPEIWRIMVKQQVASAVTEIIGPVVAILGTWIFSAIIDRAFGQDGSREGRAFFAVIVPIFAGIASTIWLIAAIQVSLQRLINPGYYAATDLIKLITGRRVD